MADQEGRGLIPQNTHRGQWRKAASSMTSARCRGPAPQNYHQRSRSEVLTTAIAKGVEALDTEQFVGELVHTK